MAYNSKFAGAQIDALLDSAGTMQTSKEDVANKVTSINADADDAHYPSAKAVKDSLAKVKNIEVTPNMLSESTKQFINASGGGTITNFADDEDLTTVDNALKLADKSYDPITYSGMGRKYLRKNLVGGKNILTQSMMPSANTIYIIQYDYDLNGATITIPENCTLDFQGGSLGNGVLNGNMTTILSSAKCIFTSLSFSGNFFANNLSAKWFGAKGDGISDDTIYLRKALEFSSNNGSALHINEGEIYYVTDNINNNGSDDIALTLNIKGVVPSRNWSYNVGKYGGIKLSSGVSLFKNKNISGSITNTCICGLREDGIYLFNNCVCSKLSIKDCAISQFDCLFADTPILSTSHISNCVFLTVYRFSINVTKDCEFTDSQITDCYINGGVEKNDNDCFGWCNYNGSVFSNNFIDYYRTIYSPMFVSSKTECMLPASIGNNYQVFRYLYTKSKGNIRITFESSNDIFNWNNVDSLEKIANFTPLQYTGQDGNKYDMPPYIACSDEVQKVSIKNAYIQRYIKEVVFYKKTITNYENDGLEVSVTPYSVLSSNAVKMPENSTNSAYLVYGGGKYKGNKVDVKGVYRTVTSLPWFAQGWCLAINGERVKYKNSIYRCQHIYDEIKETYISVWVNEDKNGIAKIGSKRPADKVSGEQFFDTTLGKPIWWTGSAWVDATGAEV